MASDGGIFQTFSSSKTGETITDLLILSYHFFGCFSLVDGAVSRNAFLKLPFLEIFRAVDFGKIQWHFGRENIIENCVSILFSYPTNSFSRSSFSLQINLEINRMITKEFLAWRDRKWRRKTTGLRLGANLLIAADGQLVAQFVAARAGSDT